MNKPDELEKLKINNDNLNFGLSVLHASIKLMELILLLAYQLSWARNTLRGATDADKAVIEQRKTEIPGRLWRDLGIRVYFLAEK
jgi:hypothetical protein